MFVKPAKYMPAVAWGGGKKKKYKFHIYICIYFYIILIYMYMKEIHKRFNSNDRKVTVTQMW